MKRLLRAAPATLFAIGSFILVRAAWQAAYSPSMDYAIVVEMARDMAAGADFPTFFHGQTYMGSLEPAVSALLCAIFGPNPFWVCMGSALLGIATLFAVMRVARRLGGEAGSCVALAFAICGGPYWLHFMVSPRGGYALATLLCLMALHIGAVAEFEDKATGRIRVAPAAAFGLAAGLAFWNNWIALPAFAAGGAALVARFRCKLLSPRLLVPAAMAFLAGGAPWLVYAIRHGFGAFASSGPPPPGPWGIVDIASIVVIRFFGVADSARAFWRSPFPWVLLSLAAFSAFDAAIGGSRGRRRFFLATALHAMLFLLAYCATSFGALHAARYFVPFVPVFAVAGGSALGAALRRIAQRPRHVAAPAIAWALLAAYAAIVAPPAIRATEDLMDGLRRKGEAWAQSMIEAAADPALARPAFADFRFFGANWVTDRRLCFVSPLIWRYRPYLLRLEAEEQPAVVANSQAFLEFCASTRGTCRTREVSGLQVTDEIAPPPEALAIPADDIASVTAGGADVRGAILDDDISTSAPASDGDALDIVLARPHVVAGVAVIPTGAAWPRGWRAEAVDEDGRPTGMLARCAPIGGWFWSGPRPYMFGPDLRLELRWEPQPLTRIRVTFEGGAARVADLRILSDETAPPCDLLELAAAVGNAMRSLPAGARVHAGRWLGTRLGASPDPALLIGHRGSDLSIPEVRSFTTLSQERGAVLVMRGNAADDAAATMAHMGLAFTRADAGGCAVFAVAPAKGAAGAVRPPLLFGGRLMREDGRTAEAP